MSEPDDNKKTVLIKRSDMPWGKAEDDPTVKMPDREAEGSAPPPPAGTPAAASSKTILYRPSSGGAGEPAADDPMANPVAGWLVIIRGPGKGASVQVGYHVNTLGRDPSNSIVLNYNDTGISRANHAEVIYDPLGRKFYVGRSGGRNLSHLNDQPLLQTVELKAGDILRMGATFLRFVPFCGEDFDWESEEKSAGGK